MDCTSSNYVFLRMIAFGIRHAGQTLEINGPITDVANSGKPRPPAERGSKIWHRNLFNGERRGQSDN